MSSSGSVFSETLQTITNTKLEELSKQQAVFNEQYSALLTAAKTEQNALERLFLLVDGAKSCLGVKTAVRKHATDGRLGSVIFGGTTNTRLETDLANLDRFLEQARYDPSVSPKVLDDWEKCILNYLSVQSSKYEYADLYGKLVTEWLSSEKKMTPPDGDIEMAESFEEIPGAKKLESRATWEKTVFEPAAVDVKALDAYLQDLFITKEKKVSKAIETFREKVEEFELTLTDSAPFNESTLRWVIEGVQSSDLLSNENREVLKDFLSNSVILAEIADVLNMRMAALNRWTWGDHVPLEQRRMLNGSYSIRMQEDLLQTVFLHYIGVKWSVFFKGALLKFRKEAWESNLATVPKSDRLRRGYYLGHEGVSTSPNLQDERAKKNRRTYFLHQLLDRNSQRIEFKEGKEEAEIDDILFLRDESEEAAYSFGSPQEIGYSPCSPPPKRKSTGGMAARRCATVQDQSIGGAMRHRKIHTDDPDAGYTPPEVKSPMEAKQGLLHLLSTEIILNTQLHGELTCFRSVFESWNSLLPHDTILTVLGFFGVSKKWLTFFKSFLQAPLKFSDDMSAAPRPRRRGTPGSHALSDVFGEIVMFCMDFSVNQTTEGGMLHRITNDFWFWSHDYSKCVKAWSSVQQFTQVMGVELNNAKSGSVRISKDGAPKDADNALPEGKIRWGFLYLDPSNGRFEIDNRMVESHIEELRKQLKSKSTSIIDWVQAWNSYAGTFFSSNFGKPANCFGRDHVNQMLDTHRHIQKSIFEGGNVVQFLKETIKERFAIKDIPDGFLFFPVELGGLDLKSPFIGLLQIRESVREDPYSLLSEFFEAEQEDFVESKRVFDSGEIRFSRTDLPDEDRDWKPAEKADEFMSLEEYCQYREELAAFGGADLVEVYEKLLSTPMEKSVDVTVQVQQALERLRGQTNLKGITNSWYSMDAYWKWVAQMYGPEMIEKFGGFNVVDPGLLPIGMVSMFRQRRTKWQG